MSHEFQILSRDAGESSSRPMIIPIPRIAISIRLGVMSDVPFLDSLQKLHTRQVGWMPTKQFEGKIKLGHVLIAEGNRDVETERRNAEVKGADDAGSAHCVSRSLRLSVSTPIGYLIGNDQ